MADRSRGWEGLPLSLRTKCAAKLDDEGRGTLSEWYYRTTELLGTMQDRIDEVEREKSEREQEALGLAAAAANVVGAFVVRSDVTGVGARLLASLSNALEPFAVDAETMNAARTKAERAQAEIEGYRQAHTKHVGLLNRWLAERFNLDLARETERVLAGKEAQG